MTPMGLPEDAASVTESLHKDDESTTRVRRLRLVVERGPDAGRELVTSDDAAVIGSHPSAALALTDPTVSRFHCELRPVERLVEIKDLGSRNGTRVDGVKILHAHLGHGARLAIGKTEVRVELRADEVALPLSPHDHFGTMVGRSTLMRRIFAVLERVAPTEATVLIEGETGTGKEVAAQSIHDSSPRREGPFVIVDCGAVPSDLLESELFGHEKGAFTGAVQGRAGAFEAAEGGTLFLDEIGELAIGLQPKLLRALESRQVKRVGANAHRTVDVRVVAATNRSLRAEVNARRFRSDLYYRLAVIEISLPPLRARPEDVPMLARHLVAKLTDEPPDLLTEAFEADLARHHWAGNVRELRNYLERCLALRELLPLGDAGGALDPLDTQQPLKVARERWNRVLERRYVEAVLGRAEGNVTLAARTAGVDRMYFYRLLWRHGLR
jgi:two-component system, NtrC family, response regulator GlrR